MKKRPPTIWCVFIALTLVSPLSVNAQKNDRAAEARARPALEMALDELERALRGSVAVDFRQRYAARRTYVGLQRGGGCDVGFRISADPPVRSPSDPNRPTYTHPHPYKEWKFNLSDLEPAEIKVEKPASGDYRVIRFAARGGKEAIWWEDFERQKTGRLTEGWIEVDEKSALRAAEALRQAIVRCRE